MVEDCRRPLTRSHRPCCRLFQVNQQYWSPFSADGSAVEQTVEGSRVNKQSARFVVDLATRYLSSDSDAVVRSHHPPPIVGR